MQRYDLRHLKDNFYERMLEVMEKDVQENEVAIFMFEIGDFSPIQKSADEVKKAGYTLMNSLKYNEVDWTIVVKKVASDVKQEAETESSEES
jgi:NADH-quinone oxidoreductase subunit E